MSVQTQIERLTKAKSDLKTAITNKGVDVPESALLDSYSVYVDGIQTGGDLEERKTISITANGSYTVNPDEGYDGIKGADVAVNVPQTGEKFTLPDKTTFYNSQFTSIDLSGCDLSQYIGGFKVSLTTYGLFTDCKLLTGIKFPSNPFPYTTNMNGMFSGCVNLISLDVSNFNTSNVTSMDDMFAKCSGLTSLDVSSFDTSNVASMNNMFNSCRKLTGLDLSNFNTSNVTDMTFMFTMCSGLTSLDLSTFATPKLVRCSYMFWDCTNLISLDVSNFNTSNVTSMNDMFKGCTSLAEVKVTNCSDDTQSKILTQLQTDLSSYTWTLTDGVITR